jgi:hypothetical protein
VTPYDFFTHKKGDANSLVRRDSISPSLANLSASFPGIPWCPGIHTTVTLLDPLSFSSAYILSNTRADSVVVFAMLLLLSKQVCILVTFFDKRSSVHFKIAFTSSWNTVERLHSPYGCPLVHKYICTCTKATANPELCTKCQCWGLILPGMQQRFIVDTNILHFLPPDFLKDSILF